MRISAKQLLVVLLAAVLPLVSITSSSAMTAGLSGTDAAEGLGWSAFLTWSENGEGGYCTGTVVGNGWVLTAAHCVYKKDASEVDYELLRVILGRSDVSKEQEGAVYRVANKQYVMPGYDPKRRTVSEKSDPNDAALLELKGFDEQRWHALPLAFEADAVHRTDNLTIFGYGDTAWASEGSRIGHGRLRKSPQGAFTQLAASDCGAKNVCFRSNGATKPLSGDSGAPWVRWFNGAWQLVAVHGGSMDNLVRSGVNDPAVATPTLATTPENQTLTQWVRATAHLPDEPDGKIVRNKDNGASWLVKAGYRHWIPTGGDFRCFRDQGSDLENLPQVSIDTIPDRVGTHAKCTSQTVGSASGPTTPSQSVATTGPSTKPPASSSSGYGLAWLQGTTLLKFAGADLSTVGSVEGVGRPDWTGVGDYDKDGKEDLFWYHGGSDSSIYALRSTGSSFSSQGRVRGPGVGKPTWAGTGDFNGDGYRNEIAWLEGTTLFMLSGNTLSTVSATQGIGTPDWAGVGDYDSDGKDDLFWFHGGTDGSIYVLKSDGKGFSSLGRIRGPGLGTPDWAGVGDFDGDGRRSDIAWHQGDKLFTFCGPQLLNCGDVSGIASPTWAGVVSLGGDQRDDLLWFQGGDDGSFYKLEMWPGTNNFRSIGRVRGPGIGTPLVAVGGVF